MATAGPVAHTEARLGDPLNQRGLIALAACALIATALTPVAKAAVPATTITPAANGDKCEWGTEPEQAIEAVTYPHSYLTGGTGSATIRHHTSAPSDRPGPP